jgi:hypothetical protein
MMTEIEIFTLKGKQLSSVEHIYKIHLFTVRHKLYRREMRV